MGSGRACATTPPPFLPLVAAAVLISAQKRLVKKTMSLSDETARQAEAVGESPVRGGIRRVVVAAALIEPQGRLVDLVYVQEHLST